MSNLAETSQGSKYSDDDRRQAITEYAVYGHIPTVSKNLNIPETTLTDWRKKDWWEAALEEVRDLNKDVIDAHLTGLVISGFKSMQDRIDNGDHYVTKDGDHARIPVKLRDVSTASGIAYDKLRLHRNQPTSIKAESADSRLNSLADKVRELQAGGNKVINGDAEEAK